MKTDNTKLNKKEGKIEINNGEVYLKILKP